MGIERDEVDLEKIEPPLRRLGGRIPLACGNSPCVCRFNFLRPVFVGLSKEQLVHSLTDVLRHTTAGLLISLRFFKRENFTEQTRSFDRRRFITIDWCLVYYIRINKVLSVGHLKIANVQSF